MSILSRRECAVFAQSEKAFLEWSEAPGRTADEVGEAVRDIDEYVKDQTRQLNEALDEQRAATLNENLGKQWRAQRHLKAQLEFVHVHPEFHVGEPDASILMQRVEAMLNAQGVPDEEKEATVELLEKAFQDLVSEKRLDYDETKGTPWARTYNYQELNAPKSQTTEDIENSDDAYNMNLDDLRKAANQQLAEQNGGPTVDGVVYDSPADIAEARRRANARGEDVGFHLDAPGMNRSPLLDNPNAKAGEEPVVSDAPNRNFWTSAIPGKPTPNAKPNDGVDRGFAGRMFGF